MRIKPLFFLLLLTITVKAQEKESFYVFDADWKPTKPKSARFFLHVHQVNDNCWQWDYYNFIGPLLKTEQFSDKMGQVRNGTCYHYNEKGWLDSTSMYRAGKKNGDFYKLRGDTLQYIAKYVYRDDSLVDVIDMTGKKDSAIKYADEKESEYPGGTGQWARYMNKNLRYPERAINARSQGEARVAFVLDKDGHILDSYIALSVEYSLDEESLRIVRNSGKWSPAFQNGKFVKSYKIQPVIFRFQ